MDLGPDGQQREQDDMAENRHDPQCPEEMQNPYHERSAQCFEDESPEIHHCAANPRVKKPLKADDVSDDLTIKLDDFLHALVELVRSDDCVPCQPVLLPLIHSGKMA